MDKKNKPIIKDIISPLEYILSKRIGGAVNINGIHYQILYACLTILKELNKGTNMSIQLEGIEDLDINNPQVRFSNSEYIQIKTSKNKLDAGTFWNLGVLQNYIEIYNIDPNSRFKLVYNMNIASGSLKELIDNKLSDSSRKYWEDKLATLEYSGINYPQFLKSISFESISVNGIIEQIICVLHQKWDVNKGAEKQFLQSLFYNVLSWSKNRKKVVYNDIKLLFQEILDSYSITPTNDAIKNNWISSVKYELQNKDYSNYYDGKAALPIHIAQGLPVRRIAWENKIKDQLDISDIIVIKSSSGQGKSTLAWQVGFNLKDNYSIYQIQFCPDWDSANSIVQFIESRINLGQLPLIIVDGLNNTIQGWKYITEKTVGLPVKYIITARNEDWYRYGSEIPKVSLHIININLSVEEAKNIYKQLEKKKKLHKDVTSWQSSWEKVQDSSLLIEYTYLLTKGEMIEDRLKYQISTLNKTQSSNSKVEILRMVSLADCMNIKIKTSNLIPYIEKTVGFQQDRGETLKELENEYFLSFKAEYIIGLHPVRSKHLVDLLHKLLPIEDSLINLCEILEENSLFEFFSNVPLLTNTNNKQNLYNKLGKYLSDRRFSEMVIALDGLLHVEPQIYWNNNKEIYNDAFNTGGIELFSMTTVPSTGQNHPILDLENLANSIGDDFSSNLKFLSELGRKLPKFVIQDTEVFLLASCLQKYLKSRTTPVDSYSGLEFLIKWFKILELPLILSTQLLSNIEIKYFIENINSFELEEAKEIALYFQNTDKEKYTKLAVNNKSTLISYLKEKTNSLTIAINKNNVFINYLLYGNNVSEANEFSVSRVQTIYTFLPFYEKYCTEAILLPYPSEELVATVKQNSIKNLSPAAIPNEFDVHLNQIWYTTLLKNYEESSVYDWQKNFIALREQAARVVLHSCQLIDSLLEGNEKKMNSILRELTNESTLFSKLDSTRKRYPTFNKKYNEKNKQSDNEKNINEWLFNFRNVNNQLVNIFTPKTEHNRNIAIINIKASCFSLENMQICFRNIMSDTFKYFDTEVLENREKEVYERLYATTQYYISRIPLNDKPVIHVAKNIAKEWWKKQLENRIQDLKIILEKINDLGNLYNFYIPTYIEETSTLTTVTIGIENIDFSSEQSLHELVIALAKLSEFPADFFIILNVQNGIALNGLRFQKTFFQKINALLTGKEEDISDLTPLPVFPDETTLRTLPELKLPNIEKNKNSSKDNKFEIIIELWKLLEYRNRLDAKSEIEKNWLRGIEQDTITKINNLSSSINDTIFLKWVQGGIEKTNILSIDIILAQINKLTSNDSTPMHGL